MSLSHFREIRWIICYSTVGIGANKDLTCWSRANPLAGARLPSGSLRLWRRLIGLSAGIWAVRAKITSRLCASRLQECPQGLNAHGVDCRLTKRSSPLELLVIHNSKRAPEACRDYKRLQQRLCDTKPNISWALFLDVTNVLLQRLQLP